MQKIHVNFRVLFQWVPQYRVQQETSCDETSAAVIVDGKVTNNIVAYRNRSIEKLWRSVR